MARKRQATRIDDTQRTLLLRSPFNSESPSGTMTIHVPDMLMRANRRQYTQCRAYDARLKVANIDNATEHNFEVYTLSNAWWVKRAIEMAKGVYLEATKRERVLLGDKKAVYSDFVISAVTGAAGNFSNLHQFTPASTGDDMTDSEVSTDESIYEATTSASGVKNDSGAEIGFTVTGALSAPNTYNIFEQYLLSRSITPDADTRAGPYQDLFGIDEDALANLQQDGDQPPWDADAFPSPFVLADTISVDQGISGGGHAVYSRMLTAPLGIIILKKRASDGSEDNFTANEQFLLDVRKGTYKGVHAPAYKAMKGQHQGLA